MIQVGKEEAVRSILRTRADYMLNITLNDEPVELVDEATIEGTTATHVHYPDNMDAHLLDADGNTITTLEFDDVRRAEVPENKAECLVAQCGNEQYWWTLNRSMCDSCVDTKHIVGTVPTRFGLVIPQQNGVVYRQQTCGVSCRRVAIEGTYIPLRTPTQFDEDTAEHIDLLDELKRANYLDGDHPRYGSDMDTDEIWTRIRDKLPFTFERVDAPNGYPPNQEALQWIRVTGATDGARDEFDNWEGVVYDQPVALFYPNSD